MPTTNQHPILRAAGRMAFLVGLVFAGLYAVFFFAQTGMIFRGDSVIRETPEQWGWTYEDIKRPVPGGETRGWFIPVENARGVVLFSHGNEGNMSTRLEQVRRLRNHGLSVLIYDYGGYGLSTGRPSEKRFYADARAMWDYLVETRGVAPHHIVLYGKSLGGGPTCELARQVKPAGVVLESTFTSMAEAAFREYPWFPASLFVRHRFDNRAKVGEISVPLLVIHSRSDTLYPFAQGQALFALAREPKQFLEVQGDNGEGAAASPRLYDQGWEDFLARALP